jgi:hypothetical protein
MTALAERIAASQEFAKSLQRSDTRPMESEDKPDEEGPTEGNIVEYDEIDSSRTLEEEIGALILQEPNHLTDQREAGPDDDDLQIIGRYVEPYTGRDFSSCTATNEWMEWDATSSV